MTDEVKEDQEVFVLDIQDVEFGVSSDVGKKNGEES